MPGKLIRYIGLAVGLMVFEKFIRYASLAVGLKPSARGCEDRLRGLYRIISSKTISPRLWNAKPAGAGESGVFSIDKFARIGHPTVHMAPGGGIPEVLNHA